MNSFTLRTFGHATMVVSQDDEPLVATDPWLLGSCYWRSWWLDQEPTAEELDLVANARAVYLTHSHPDHMHFPTLRALGVTRTYHPKFPSYGVPNYIRSIDQTAVSLDPCRWYHLSDEVRMMSVPVFADDSMLIVETPNATVVDINDSPAPASLLRLLRRRFLADDRPIIALKSHSPASSGASMYRNGIRQPLHAAADYARIMGEKAAALGATHVASFASQAFAGRADSVWSNEFKVFWTDLEPHWEHPEIKLVPPHVKMDLTTLKYECQYLKPDYSLSQDQASKVTERAVAERAFVMPADFHERLERYLASVRGLRWALPHGLGFKLATTETNVLYDTRRKRVVDDASRTPDAIVTVPDMVLYEALRNNVLTDLGITMIIRTDSNVDIKRPYSVFSLMGLRDAGHFTSLKTAAQCGWFYARFVEPRLFALWWGKRASSSQVRPLPGA